MSTLKTLPNDSNVHDFINSVADENKKQDSFELLKMYETITGEKPKMWGTSIIGFGMYHYKSERSRQEGDWPLAGFSPRKQNLTLYFMSGFSNDYQNLLKKLGKHSTSMGCLYIKRLSDINIDVLKELIELGYKDSKKKLLNT
jgi:hypothetical protein